MESMKYAIIQPLDNTVSLVSTYVGEDWLGFKLRHESAHPKDEVVYINGTKFPEGQNWWFDGDNYRPKDGSCQSFEITRNNIIKQITDCSNNLKFNTPFSFNGHLYCTDKEYMSFYGILNSLKYELPPTKFPIKIPQIDEVGGFLLLNNSDEVELFTKSVIYNYLNICNENYDIVQQIKSYTKIIDLIKFIDNR